MSEARKGIQQTKPPNAETPKFQTPSPQVLSYGSQACGELHCFGKGSRRIEFSPGFLQVELKAEEPISEWRVGLPAICSSESLLVCHAHPLYFYMDYKHDRK